MKLIPLTQGKFALVDDEDYDFLMQWKWFAVTDKKRGTEEFRAGRMSRVSEGLPRKIILMHRVIMRVENPELEVDHIDFNPLNNTKKNLRICSSQENMMNRRPYKNGKSKYKGVSPYENLWVVKIQKDKKFMHLGSFPKTPEGEVAAAKLYDEYAKKLHGEFANLNFKT